MNSNFNLCDLLKGCEGQTFFSACAGEVTLVCIQEGQNKCIRCHISGKDCSEWYDKKGRISINQNRCVLFPSKALFNKYPLEPEKAWDEWYLNTFTNDTWCDLVERRPQFADEFPECIQKSADAFARIATLIKYSYGGTPSANDVKFGDCCEISYFVGDGLIIFECQDSFGSPLVFKSKALAEKFLSHKENRDLVYEFFSIINSL